MMLTQDQINAANQANMETLTQMTQKAFDGVEKLMELNIQVAKTVMHENVEHLKEASQAKDAKELLSLQANFVQPFAEKTISYSKHLFNIASETQKALNDVSSHDFQSHTKKLHDLICDMGSYAPGSSDAMVNMIKQAVANANTVFESSQKAVKQAIDMTSHQTKSATDSALKASESIFKTAIAH
jgi:phasin family protein